MLDSDFILSRGVAEILPSRSALKDLLTKKKIRLYLGIDPTGSLLTLGHAVVLRKLTQFAEAGHEVILLVGNGTVRIGDPTGRDTTRPVLTDAEIRENFQNWKIQASKVLDFDKITLKYNGDWLDKLQYSDLIKLLAKVTVPQLMERDMFQQRLKKGGTVFGHEVLYPLLQGYDSVVMDVDLEVGGTDQTFNMLMGRTLQRAYNNREKFVLTTPLIPGTDGRKMSKSYNNFIALTDPPIEMFGKLMSIADEVMPQYYEVFTEVETKISAEKIKTSPRDAKVELAQYIVTWLHSAEAAEQAYQDFVTKFVKKAVPSTMPTFTIKQPVGVLDLLSQVTQFASSNSEARRLITGGGVYLDDNKITDPTQIIKPPKKAIVLKVGKRKFARLQ